MGCLLCIWDADTWGAAKKAAYYAAFEGNVAHTHTAECCHPESSVLAMQETEPLDIIIVRRGQRNTGEAFILLRMPIQVEMVLRKDKTYIGKRYVEVNLAKKLVRASVRVIICWHQSLSV